MTTNPQGTLTLHTATGARKYLTTEERLRFLEAAEQSSRREIYALCATLAWTGCRISEALALTADSLNASDGFIAVRCLKKRGQLVVIREIPVPDFLTTSLVELAARRPQASRLWGWSRSRAWQIVKAVMREAGIEHGPHASPKGLRHSYGLTAVRTGVPLNFVQRWLGHASMSTTAIYLQAVGPEERSIAARMWDAQI